jgi:hypothetical protein
MAKSKSSLTHKKTLTETIKFSGEVSEDGLYITLDGVQTPIANLFKKFAGKAVDASVGTKQEDDVK